MKTKNLIAAAFAAFVIVILLLALGRGFHGRGHFGFITAAHWHTPRCVPVRRFEWRPFRPCYSRPVEFRRC